MTPPILASLSGEATIRDPELHAGGVEPPARPLLVEQLAGNRALIGRPARPEDEGQVTVPTPSTSQRRTLRLRLAARAAFADRCVVENDRPGRSPRFARWAPNLFAKSHADDPGRPFRLARLVGPIGAHREFLTPRRAPYGVRAGGRSIKYQVPEGDGAAYVSSWRLRITTEAMRISRKAEGQFG